MADETKQSGVELGILKGTEGVKEVVPGIHILPGQGNCLMIDLGDRLVLVDAGPGGGVTAKMIASMRELSDKPLEAICYSHGHAGYNAGIPQWLEHAEKRGDPAPRLIAQENLVRRYKRYRDTSGLQMKLNQSQFPNLKVLEDQVYTDPTETFHDSMVIKGSERHVEVFAAPSETDDTIGVWVPGPGVLYGSAATPGSTIPNVGTPLRTQRYTIRWAETLERYAALKPKYLVQEFGPVVEPAEAINNQLSLTIEALRWLHEEVRVRMNRGMNATEIVYDIDPPERLFNQPWMGETYGAVDYLIRDLYREENGWWENRNPTSLHPILPEAAAAVIANAITDKQAILDSVRQLADAGKTQEALHVVDTLAMAPGDDPHINQARTLKAELCLRRAKEVRPYVSKALLRTSAKRYEDNDISWAE